MEDAEKAKKIEEEKPVLLANEQELGLEGDEEDLPFQLKEDIWIDQTPNEETEVTEDVVPPEIDVWMNMNYVTNMKMNDVTDMNMNYVTNTLYEKNE